MSPSDQIQAKEPTCCERVLKDMETGELHFGFNDREDSMMATITMPTFEGLRSRSFAAFRPARLQVDDAEWQSTIGYVIGIPGGCEVEVDDERLEQLIAKDDEGLVSDASLAQVPVVIRDPYFPAVKCTVMMRALRMGFNEIDSGSGPRNGASRKRCTHRPTDPPAMCEYCFWRWTEVQRSKPNFGARRWGSAVV